MSKPFIYALCEPEDIASVRYIGMSAIGNVRRPYSHIHEATCSRGLDTRLHRWIRKLVRLGKCYEVVIIEELEEGAERSVVAGREIAHIAEFKARGYNLVNATIGGDGVVGCKHSEESKRKLSKSLKSFYQTEEGRAIAARPRLYRRGKREDKEQGIAHSQKMKVLWSKIPKDERDRIAAIAREGLKRMSPEAKAQHRARFSEARKGHIVTEETREKIRKSLVGRTQTEEHKRRNAEGVKRSWEKRRAEKKGEAE